MDSEKLFTAGEGYVIRDPGNDRKPNPCPDCKRTYLVKESVQVNVEGRQNPVWEGCIDCWLVRTSPEMCQTFEVKR